MQLTVLGYNHQTTPLPLREQLVFSPEALPDALAGLIRCPGVREAAIVSTCNRTELYCNACDPEPILEWLIQSRGQVAAISGGYQLKNEAAVQHISRVASGLDSMVLGETQILKQLKEAEQHARTTGTLGVLLNKLFRHVFSVSKEVRSCTQIRSTSVPMAAAMLAEQRLSSLKQCQVLFVGAGKMVELCIHHFIAQHPKRIAVANRTHERGISLADKVHGEALSLEEIPLRFSEFDVVITSTASSVPLIRKNMVEQALKIRHGRPVLIIDLAVPRNVEPEVGQLPGVHLCTIDDLSHLVRREDNRSHQAEVQIAEQVISRRLPEFTQWLASRRAVPAICALKDYAHRMTRRERARAQKQLETGLSPEAVFDQFAKTLTNKMLHGPIAALNAAQGEDQIELYRLLQKLYPLQATD